MASGMSFHEPVHIWGAGCLVRWDEQQESFLCPCHGAVFDKNGIVVAGPPPRPLQKLQTKVEAGILYVKET